MNDAPCICRKHAGIYVAASACKNELALCPLWVLCLKDFNADFIVPFKFFLKKFNGLWLVVLNGKNALGVIEKINANLKTKD